MKSRDESRQAMAENDLDGPFPLNTFACVQCGAPATQGENFAMCDEHAFEIDHYNWSVEGDSWPLLDPMASDDSDS